MITLSYRDKREIATMIAEELKKEWHAPDIVDRAEWMKRTGKTAGSWYALLRTSPEVVKTKRGGKAKMVDWKAYVGLYQ